VFEHFGAKHCVIQSVFRDVVKITDVADRPINTFFFDLEPILAFCDTTPLFTLWAIILGVGVDGTTSSHSRR
jgi:hypothetical protein